MSNIAYRTMLAATVTMGACLPPAIAVAPAFLPAQQVGTVQNSSIKEASGLAASRMHPGVLWVHNDSGDTARVFAMNTQGTHLGIYNFTGASATDWEDIAIGPGPAGASYYLFAGDIGDNNAVRATIRVYRVPEPVVAPNQSPVTVNLSGIATITLQYPDGPRDAETLMVDPVTRDIYVVSKRETYSRLYRAAYPQSTSQTTVMEYRGQLPWGWATGGDISPNGGEILVRGYSNASLWRRPAGTALWDAFARSGYSVPLAGEPQGEAICFDFGAHGYWTVSEGTSRPLYYYGRVPAPGDQDADGDVDGADYGWFAGCFNGTGNPVSGGCQAADLNGDHSVDGADYGIFASCFNATGNPPACE